MDTDMPYSGICVHTRYTSSEITVHSAFCWKVTFLPISLFAGDKRQVVQGEGPAGARGVWRLRWALGRASKRCRGWGPHGAATSGSTGITGLTRSKRRPTEFEKKEGGRTG